MHFPCSSSSQQLPPAYVFSVPPEARAYLIGTGGANLTRIQEETPGIRITRGRPKTESDPYDRDFLVYNDNTLPQEMLDIVLGKLCRIVRRKIQDWLPLEGKAAEDARRLLDEGKLNDNGDRSPQFHQNQNGRGNEYAQGTVQASAGESDHFGARDISREASSSPVDTFPSQVSILDILLNLFSPLSLRLNHI